ncbi:MAG TPA: pentapeptide repeat-containing protein, partial [Vicinamibacterales bacterium]|nr:pentapeptide repeat-containing protein [Vicinamibacterales bacterium]
MMAYLTVHPISVESLIAAAQGPERGGTCVFMGTVRQDDDVTSIEYSAYDEMAIGEIERMLAEHRLYLETEYHEGHRANFSSADLTGRDFSGLNLRGIKMERALLSGADFTGAHLQSANLIGAILQAACFD